MDEDDDDLDELQEGRDDLEGLFDALLEAGDRQDRAARGRRAKVPTAASQEGCG